MFQDCTTGSMPSSKWAKLLTSGKMIPLSDGGFIARNLFFIYSVPSCSIMFFYPWLLLNNDPNVVLSSLFFSPFTGSVSFISKKKPTMLLGCKWLLQIWFRYLISFHFIISIHFYYLFHLENFYTHQINTPQSYNIIIIIAWYKLEFVCYFYYQIQARSLVVVVVVVNNQFGPGLSFAAWLIVLCQCECVNNIRIILLLKTRQK